MKLGHVWEYKFGPYVHRAHISSKGEWYDRGNHIECTRCGLALTAKPGIPDETMRFLGVPSCDEFMIESVMLQ